MEYEEEEYWDDEFDEEGLYEHYRQHGVHSAPKVEWIPFHALLQNCILPIIRGPSMDTFKFLFLCAILQRIVTRIPLLPVGIKHVSTLLMGLFLCHRIFEFHGTAYLIFLSALGISTIFILQTLRSQSGTAIMTLLCFSFMITSQLILLDDKQFLGVRGGLMVLTMKLVSIPTHTKMYRDPLCLLGYSFDCSTVVFGPWVPISDYVAALESQRKQSWVKQGIELCSIVYNILLAFLFMLTSTCFLMWLLPDSFAYYNRWIIAFRDAMSFRMSHYFITTISYTSLLIAGHGLLDGDCSVSDPLALEIPRSLVAGVVRWNLPMHRWVKLYMFDDLGKILKRSKLPRGVVVFLQRFLTFAGTSLLHGLNFQLSAVLLSLGFYTYIEYSLRRWLAGAFNACVKAWPCRDGCSHKHKKYHWISVGLNLMFSLLAMFQLAYLGSVFDDDEIQHVGYSMGHTIVKWGLLGWTGHITACALFIFSLLMMDQLSFILVPIMLFLTCAFGYRLINNFQV